MGWGVNDYPDPPQEGPFPICPVCGAETDTLYMDRHGDIFGCDECVKTVDAWDYMWDMEE